MYAVIESGGKQYRVSIGERVRVESLAVEPGATVELDKVLAIADDDDVQIGTPHLTDTTVKATVVGHGRGEKIRVFKMKRRKNYRRTLGHRQNFTELEITAIGDVAAPAASPAQAAREPDEPAPAAPDAAGESAATQDE